jgi:hypothetical protein
MPAFEVVASSSVNPGAAFKETTINPGQTFAVRTTPEGTNVHLCQMWGDNASGGEIRIRSPRMHDNVQGIRVRVPKLNNEILLPYDVAEKLYNQDVLIVEQTGGAGETDAVFYLNYYSQLPGSEGAFRTWSEVQPRIKNYLSVPVQLKTGAVAGQWGVAKALNSVADQFKRPYEYAILGYTNDEPFGALAFHGTDIGELRCGGPAPVKPDLTQEWFIRLSEETNSAAIPTFQAANVPTIQMEAVQAAAEGTKNITVICAQLA